MCEGGLEAGRGSREGEYDVGREDEKELAQRGEEAWEDEVVVGGE